MHTTTHTYAVLPVSSAAYQEIRALLEKAGYGDQFHDGDADKSWPWGEVIDMHGIALQAKCDHQWEDKTIPGTPDGPTEYLEVCKLCGMENPGSFVE